MKKATFHLHLNPCEANATAIVMVAAFLCGLAGQTFATGGCHNPGDTQLVAPRHHATCDATAFDMGIDPVGNTDDTPWMGLPVQKIASSRTSYRPTLQKNGYHATSGDPRMHARIASSDAHHNLLADLPRWIPLRV